MSPDVPTVASLLWLVLAFVLFTAGIWSVYALNRYAAARYGSAPFTLPNAALMLVVNLLLFSALRGAAAGAGSGAGGEAGFWIKLAIVAGLSLWMLAQIARRTRLWLALYAVALMAIGSVAILPSLVFHYFTVAGGDDGR